VLIGGFGIDEEPGGAGEERGLMLRIEKGMVMSDATHHQMCNI
jgi:hypothetical protein